MILKIAPPAMHDLILGMPYLAANDLLVDPVPIILLPGHPHADNAPVTRVEVNSTEWVTEMDLLVTQRIKNGYLIYTFIALIIERVNESTVIAKDNHLTAKLLRPFVPNDPEQCPAHEPPRLPPPILEDNQWEVDAILDERIRYRRKEYLAHWKGYPDEDNMWVKTSDVSVDLISDYRNNITTWGDYFFRKGRSAACPNGSCLWLLSDSDINIFMDYRIVINEPLVLSNLGPSLNVKRSIRIVFAKPWPIHWEPWSDLKPLSELHKSDHGYKEISAYCFEYCHQLDFERLQHGVDHSVWFASIKSLKPIHNWDEYVTYYYQSFILWIAGDNQKLLPITVDGRKLWDAE
jgi:Chromo (CHRromatin Organisation MOdifier) domain